MRISTAQIYQQSVTSMLNQQTELAKTQQQLSTGKNILSPSDDPASATRILNLNQVIETTEQFQRNSNFAETRLAIEESALTNISDVLQRVRDLAVQAANDVNTAADRASIAIEVRSSIDSLLALSNSKDVNGDYMFAGYKTDTRPFSHDGLGNFSYDGDQGQKNLQIGPKRQIATNDTGHDVFLKVDDGAGGISSLFGAVYDFAVDLEANTTSTTTLTRLDSAFDSIIDTRASIGARMNIIDSQSEANENFNLVLKQNLSSIEDLDYAEAVSRFEQQLLALQASQQSFVKIEGLSLFNYL